MMFKIDSFLIKMIDFSLLKGFYSHVFINIPFHTMFCYSDWLTGDKGIFIDFPG